MAASAETGSKPVSAPAQVILSEEQIEQLLQEAEQRLRAKAGVLAIKEHAITALQRKAIPNLQHGLDSSHYIKEQNGIAVANRNVGTNAEQKKMANELRAIEKQPGSNRINDVLTSGPNWYDLPKTELTPQLRRDLQLIEMRNVLDPHRHYKKNARKGKIPTFSHVGTVIEGPTEFFSGRINRKDRSKTFVEEALKTEADNGRFKRKYNEIQEKKTSGKKAHYKKLMAKRKKS